MILTGYDAEVAEWVAARVPFGRHMAGGKFTAIGVMCGDQLIGGVVYNNYVAYDETTANISMHVAGVGNWLTRGALRAFFSYPFIQLGCNLVVGVVPKRAKKVRRFDEKLGFTIRGVLPGFFPGDDACIYTMSPDQCRWIN